MSFDVNTTSAFKPNVKYLLKDEIVDSKWKCCVAVHLVGSTNTTEISQWYCHNYVFWQKSDNDCRTQELKAGIGYLEVITCTLNDLVGKMVKENYDTTLKRLTYFHRQRAIV